jgi:hypothetical protein
MPQATFDRVLAFSKEYGGGSLCITSQGELTFLRDWMEQCSRIIDRGYRLYTVTNLAKRLSRDEARCLLGFSGLTVSVDTANAEILKRVRRKVSLGDILYNIVLIRALAAEQALTPPPITFNCVYTDANAGRIAELAGLCVSLGCQLMVSAFNRLNYLAGGPSPIFTNRSLTNTGIPCLALRTHAKSSRVLNLKRQVQISTGHERSWTGMAFTSPLPRASLRE